MDRTKEENEKKLMELAEKYKDEDFYKKNMMRFAIVMSRFFDGTRKIGEYNPALQGPIGTWAEQVDQDMDRYEELFEELKGKYKEAYPPEFKWIMKLMGSDFNLANKMPIEEKETE